MDEQTIFRLVMPSAQESIPIAERRPRLFLQDGTEIFGMISFAVSGGDISGIGERTYADAALLHAVRSSAELCSTD